MGRTINLRTIIQTKLSSYCSDCTYRHSKKTHTGNWIVYDIEDFSSDENLSQVKLEVDLMGTSADTAAIENLADTIWEGLDHWDYIDSNLVFSCYQNVKNNIDEESDVQHRRLVFSIRLFK